MKQINYENLNSVNIDIKITNLAGKEIDITEYFLLLEIIEDITNFTVIGNLNFVDSLGLKETFPILGGEKLKIKFNTNDTFQKYEKEFIITKIGTETQINVSRNIREIKLYFSSVELLTNYKKSFSKSYKHKKISDIINEIFQKQLESKKEIEIEDTKNSISFISNYWNPFQTIRFLMNKSISSINLDSGFLFFEDKDKFNFKSITEIFKQSTDKKLIFHRMNQESKKLVGFVGLIDYFYPIKTIDLIENIKKGITGSKLVTYDYSTKSYMNSEINYEKSFETTQMGNNLLYKENELTKNSKIEFYNNYISDRIIDNIEYQNIIEEQSKVFLRNKILYNSLNDNSIVIGKPGDSELSCGQIIDVEQKSFAEENTYNDKMNGKMLIKSIKHKIDKDEGYKQVALLTKMFYSNDNKNITKKL